LEIRQESSFEEEEEEEEAVELREEPKGRRSRKLALPPS